MFDELSTEFSALDDFTSQKIFHFDPLQSLLLITFLVTSLFL